MVDLSGNGKDATLQNVNYNEASGWTEKSLILDGSDDWVKMPYIYNDNMTIEIVMKPIKTKEGKEEYFLSSIEAGGIAIGKAADETFESYAYINGAYQYLKNPADKIENNKRYSLSTRYDGSTYYSFFIGEYYLSRIDLEFSLAL